LPPATPKESSWLLQTPQNKLAATAAFIRITERLYQLT
jgi:hypothetical protein